jgi:type I restriction enzyme S subunit
MRKGWEMKKLGDVCKVIAGQSPEGKYYNQTGNGLPFYQGKKEFGDKYIGEPTTWTSVITKEAIENDILMSVRAPVGPVNFATQKVCIGRGLASIRASEKINQEFLYNFLIFNEKNLQGNEGAVFNSINKSQIENISIPLPPLSEQQRIVSILDKCFTAIDQAKSIAEQNLKNAKELFESYLNGVFENKGEDWEERKLGDIGKVSMCKRIFKEETKPEGEIPFYKIGTFGKEPDAFISTKVYNEYKKKYSFPKMGDILISASGTIGRCVPYDGEPAYFQDSNIVWIDNDEKQILNEFLHKFYLACKWESTKGATISRLYNDNLRQIKISFPKSKTEQKQIVTKLDAIKIETKKLENQYKKKLGDLEEMKKSVLKKAFNGELLS